MSVLSELVRNKFGGPTTSSETIINVSTNPYPILKNNPQRVMAFIQNLGPEGLAVSFNPSLDLWYSVFLSVPGTITLLVDEDGDLVGHELWGATAGGETWVVVWEVIRL